MGEKETMSAADTMARSGGQHVPASPGGSQTASLTGKAASPADPSDDAGGDGSSSAKGPNAVNVKLA